MGHDIYYKFIAKDGSEHEGEYNGTRYHSHYFYGGTYNIDELLEEQAGIIDRREEAKRTNTMDKLILALFWIGRILKEMIDDGYKTVEILCD